MNLVAQFLKDLSSALRTFLLDAERSGLCCGIRLTATPLSCEKDNIFRCCGCKG